MKSNSCAVAKLDNTCKKATLRAKDLLTFEVKFGFWMLSGIPRCQAGAKLDTCKKATLRVKDLLTCGKKCGFCHLEQSLIHAKRYL